MPSPTPPINPVKWTAVIYDLIVVLPGVYKTSHAARQAACLAFRRWVSIDAQSSLLSVQQVSEALSDYTDAELKRYIVDALIRQGLKNLAG